MGNLDWTSVTLQDEISAKDKKESNNLSIYIFFLLFFVDFGYN